ncbi:MULTISPECIES: DUF637 domain-containing protein [Acinetobacter]|uniref:two-partner secretion domain-containing protein n=1 Tax=Acinetobacter TaxID=469 RepID=UPI00141B656F|nr:MULTISPECIES: DUF637 domain-containing protein [Acinetobacter]MCS4299156.1 filamentous hemagglutinin [Acinetobacter guillouiae]MCW2250197.1 filamentous hemagglutinin [Acinetobacter sp. BIGb0204]NII39300.1 filamentous hemagglutinin [Acinetobacter sp. BIGb0196]
MNKNRYRIIFSKAKNMFIAVAENIKSQSKATGQSTHSTPIAESVNIQDSKSFHQLWQVKSIVASMSLFMAFSPVYAQMQADPNAAAAQRASIGVGKNQQGQNVPVVNIQTPKNGVSHNVYNQFDVLQPGVVLNNSRNGAGSVIVGQVGANPYLQTGEARVILNEVNSSAASQFRGNLEIAGQRADVIIANPSGINIQGGGFINANKAIFTTGKPQLNADGSIKQFVVNQGKVNVNSTANNLGLGGNNNNADYVDIYAKAVELNAQVHANQALQLITGSNTISEDSTSITPNQANSTTPTFALDVKALGGMYANNIFIIGTDKGLGVSNAGTIQALNNLVITSTGQIVNSGLISSTSKKHGLLSIKTTETGTAGDINTSGTISSNTLINIDSGNNLNLNANQIILNNGGVVSSPLLINTQGNLNLASNTRIMNDSSNADLYIDAANINLATNSEIRSNRGSANINIKNNLIAAQNAGLVVSYDLNIATGNKQELKGSLLQATVGAINLKAGSNNSKGLINIQDGTVWAGTNLNLNSSGDIAIKNMGLVADNAVSKVKNINAYSDQNLTWEHTGTALAKISGKVQLDAANKLNLLNSTLSAKDDINLQANQLVLESALTSDKSINITSKVGDLTLSHALTANGNINASADKGSLTTSGLKATSNGGKLSLMAGKNVTLTHAGLTRSVLLGAQGVNVASVGDGNVTSLSTDLYSNQGNVLVSSNLRNTLTDTTLNATKNIEVFAKDNLTLDGVITLGRAHTALNSKKNIYINSIAGAADVPVFSSAKSSQFASTGSLSVTSGADINVQNAKLTGGAVLVEAGGGFNPNTAVELNATGSDLLKNDTKINSINGDLSVQTNKTLNIDPKKITLKVTGDIELVSKAGDLNLLGYGGVAGNGSEQVVKLNTLNGGISLTGQNVMLQGAELKAKQDINLVATTGNVVVDGVKNTLTNKSNSTNVKKIIENLNADKIRIASLIEPLHSNQIIKDFMILMDKYHLAYTPRYIGHIDNPPTDMATRKRIFQLRYDAFLQNYPILVSINKVPTNLNFSPPMKLTFDGISYNPYFEDVKNLKNNFDMEALFRGLFNLKYSDKDLNQINNDINFFNQNLNGYEHSGSNLISSDGNITLASAKGISISGSNFDAQKGAVRIEAAGTLVGEEHKIQGKYQSTVPTSVKQGTLKASVIVDGLQDSYEIGQVANENYRWRSPVSITTINGDKGVKILATGKGATDNLILQGVGITANNGDVNIEAYKNIIFDVAIENGYDKSKTTETKRKWYGKKKTTTTVETAEQSGGVSVDIAAKNINIKSQEKNTDKMTGQNRTSIDMYSSQLTANGGKISIQAGGDLNFLTANDESLNTTDISKKSSFIGIKLNNSRTTNTRNIKSELPAVLNANYIGTKSGFDTLLKGTVFNYLDGADIQAGGNISLENASTIVSDTSTKKSNSVVWQSMQDKGSITETAKLPSFNGLTPPVFKAAGGISVQIPVGEKDQNKVQIRDEILRLANQPGNEYLKDLVNRNDVDWNKAILTQKDWDYKSQGLTGAGAAIVVIIVTVLTSGAASGAASAISGLSGSLGASAGASAAIGAGAGAAVSTLATQASISLINNGGDIGKTLKDLGSKESVKGLVASVVTAGLLKQVGTTLGLKPESTLFPDRLMNNFTNAVGSTLVQTAINGGDLQDNLEKALLAGLAGALQGEFASQIGGSGLDKVDPSTFEYVLHKIAHAAAGCAAAAATKASCEAGAIGAGVGEIVAGLMIPEGKTALDLTDDERTRIKDTSKIIAGTTAAFAGYDVNTAANSADIAVTNNSLPKLATSGAKIAKKVIDQIRSWPANKPLQSSDVSKMFKDAGVQEIVDVADNIKTLISPTATWFDKISAAVDLAVGVDIKAGKDVALAMKDKHIIQLKDPGPIHHICTNKNCLSSARGGPWTPQFQKYFDGAGLDINTAVENLVALPNHKGPHPKEYHAYVEKELRLAVSSKKANTKEYRDAVIGTLGRIKSEALVSGSQVNKWLTK